SQREADWPSASDRGVRCASGGEGTPAQTAGEEEGIGARAEGGAGHQRNHRSDRALRRVRLLCGRKGADSGERDGDGSRDGSEAPLQARGHPAGGDHRHRRVEEDPTVCDRRGKSRGARVARGVEEVAGEARGQGLRNVRGSTEGQEAAVAAYAGCAQLSSKRRTTLTNWLASLERLTDRGVEQSGSSSGS